MERPSHNIRALSLQSASRRFLGAGLAVVAQFGLAGLFIAGLVVQAGLRAPPPMQVTEVKNVAERTPPPPIKVERPAMPTMAMPLIDIAPDNRDGSGNGMQPPPPPQDGPVTARQLPTPPAAAPDRAPAAIAETHTSPPYPSLARRLGAEGKVMLRLTVLPNGMVGKAEVVTSSGRQDLDQAAVQWIVGHWTYRPALRDGAPASVQVLAAVQFSLSNSP